MKKFYVPMRLVFVVEADDGVLAEKLVKERVNVEVRSVGGDIECVREEITAVVEVEAVH